MEAHPKAIMMLTINGFIDEVQAVVGVKKFRKKIPKAIGSDNRIIFAGNPVF